MKHTENRLPEHSKHKVEFYRQYLAAYFSILFNTRSKVIDSILIIETHSGAGKYGNDDGSALVLANELKTGYERHLVNRSDNAKDITVLINDKSQENVNSAFNLIREIIPSQIDIEQRSKDGAELLEEIANYTSKQKVAKPQKRFLIFIDPYGYKEIAPESISKLAQSGNSDILLFMPIEEMYRFANAALASDGRRGMGPLKKLVENMNAATNKIIPYRGKLDLCRTFCEYLNFENKCYSSFMMIERENGFNALFFVTHHPKAQLEINRIRWGIDKNYGTKYELNQNTSLLVQQADTKQLENLFRRSIDLKPLTNIELLELTLRSGFMPRHINKIVKDFVNERLVEVEALDVTQAKSNTLYLNEDEVNSKKPKLRFRWRTAE